MIAPPDTPVLARAPLAASRGWAVVSLVLALLWLCGLGSLLGVIGGAMHRRANPDHSSPTRRVAAAAIVVGVIGVVVTVASMALLTGSMSKPS